MNRQQAHELVDNIFDQLDSVKVGGPSAKIETKAAVINPQDEAKPAPGTVATPTPDAPPPKPKGQRVVRTKSSGDRVYLLSEETEPKKRQWVYDPPVLESLGFNMGDVVEIEDSELLKYTMGPAILKPIEKNATA